LQYVAGASHHQLRLPNICLVGAKIHTSGNHMPADRWVRTMVSLIAIIAIFAALNVGSSVVAPVVCAIFIISIVWPMQSRLQKHLPKLLALAIVIGITVIVFVFFASLATWGLSRIGRSLIAEAGRFQALYAQATAWLEDHGIIIAGLWAEHFNMGWLLRAMQGATARLNTTITFWLVALVYIILGLLEVDDIRQKFETLKNREAARIVLSGSTKIAAKFRRYMLIRTAMSLATGAMVWALAVVFGLEFAAEWGCDRLYAELHPLYRIIHRHGAPYLVRPGSARIVASRAHDLRLPEYHSISDRQLH
jgi:AI-2 transport protein TqsA